jgi:hypothetical protein
MRTKSIAKTLLAASIGLALAAAPAAAEEASSVDAYSGQAAVLGAPRPHSKQGKVPANGGGGNGGGAHTRAGGPASSGSSQGPSGGAGGPSSGTTAGKGTPGKGGGASSASGKGDGTGVAATGQTADSTLSGGEASGSLSLSAPDVLLLLALLGCLLGVAVLMRRLGRHAQ